MRSLIYPATTRSRPKRASLLMSIVLLMTLIAAACSGSGDESASTSNTASADFASEPEAPRASYVENGDALFDSGSDDSAEGDFDAPADEATAETARVTGSSGSEAVAQALPDLGRDIIYTALLELGATDVTSATRDAIRAVEARGGFLFSQDTQGGNTGASVLVFKILPDQFQATLNDLGSFGTVRSQSISADDVTSIVVDLQSRINTAAASVERLRDLLDESNNFERIATLENQLLQRETTLEQLRGQLRTVQNQVDLATITVRLTPLLNRPGMQVQTTAFSGHDGGFSCFDASLLRSAEPGDPATLCYRITNTGDTPLVNLELDDQTFGGSIGDLLTVDGNATQIDPGETLILAHELELIETVRVRSSFTATALDTDGNPLEESVTATAAIFRLDVIEPDDGIPSFGDVISGSLSALATAAIVLALVAVAVAPFLAVGLVLFWIGMQIWRRRPERPAPTAKAAPAPPVGVDADSDKVDA